MKKKSAKNRKSKIIDQIETIRSKNNANWMDILRIAFEYAPEKTSKTISKIYSADQKISKLAKKLSE